MEIKLRIIEENPDGSANAMVDFDREGLEFLVQEGILHILEAYIEQNKNARAGQKLREKLDKAREDANDVWGKATGKKKGKKNESND